MANYNRDYGIENNILLNFTIVKSLNNDYENTFIELKEFLLKNKIDDLRLKITLYMMHDDLAILLNKKSELFINKINEDIIKEIPTLAPKYYYLKGIINGKSINEMSAKYYEEISKINECIFYEEFPFSIKLSKFDGKETICSKIFMSKRIQLFINA